MSFTSITPSPVVAGDLVTITGTQLFSVGEGTWTDPYRQLDPTKIELVMSVGSQQGQTLHNITMITHTYSQITFIAPNFNGKGNVSVNLLGYEPDMTYPELISSIGYGTLQYPTTTITYVGNTLNVGIGETIAIYGTNLQYTNVSIVYYDNEFYNDGGWYGFSKIPSYTLTPDNSQKIITIPNHPTGSQSQNCRWMKLHIEMTTLQIPLVNPIVLTYPNPIITNVSPITRYGCDMLNVTVTGQNLIGLDNAWINTESVFSSPASNGTSITLTGYNINSSGKVKLGYENNIANAVLESSQVVNCIFTPIIDSFTPSTGIAGTNVTINGHNLMPTVTPTVTFNGVAASIISANQHQIVVSAPMSTTGRIVVNNNSTGSATSATDYVYPPINITVTPQNVILNGKTITNRQYSKNGGAWTNFTSAITILSTDLMKYRATFGGSGGCYAIIEVDQPVNDYQHIEIQRPTASFVLTLQPDFTNIYNYTVKFTAKA